MEQLVAKLRVELAGFFTLLVDDKDGIDARYYRIDSCSNNVLGSKPINNCIPPISDLFRLSKERSNELLIAAGLLTTYMQGRHTGSLIVNRGSWDALKSEFLLPIEVQKTTQEATIGIKVWCIQVGSFRDARPFNALTQAKLTSNNMFSPKRIRLTSELKQLYYAVALPLVRLLAKEEEKRTSDVEDSESDVEAATVSWCSYSAAHYCICCNSDCICCNSDCICCARYYCRIYYCTCCTQHRFSPIRGGCCGHNAVPSSKEEDSGIFYQQPLLRKYPLPFEQWKATDIG
jgi:hypothetical protein